MLLFEMLLFSYYIIHLIVILFVLQECATTLENIVEIGNGKVDQSIFMSIQRNLHSSYILEYSKNILNFILHREKREFYLV